MSKPYEIGYGRPPKRTRFKPGQSGNPSGRRAEKKSPLDAEAEILFGKPRYTLLENGKARRYNAVMAVKKVQLAKALKGDQRAIDGVLKRADHVAAALEKREEERDPHAERARILQDAILKIFTPDPEEKD
jgi:hypothetical protein